MSISNGFGPGDAGNDIMSRMAGPAISSSMAGFPDPAVAPLHRSDVVR